MAAFGDDGPLPGERGRDRRGAGRRRRGPGPRATDVPRPRRIDARRPRRSPSRCSASTRPPSRRSATCRWPRASASPGRRRSAALVTERLAAEDGLAVGSNVTFQGGADGPVALTVEGILAGDGPFVGSGGRTVVVPLRTAQRLLVVDGVSRVDIIVGEGATPAEVSVGARGRADRRAVRPVVAARPRRVAPLLDRRLPVDDRADRRGRAVRRRVPHLQHALDDRDRADPRAGPAAGSRRDPRPARAVRPRPGGGARRSSAPCSGSRPAPGSPSLMAGYVRTVGSIPFDAPQLGSGSIAIALAIGLGVTLAASVEPARRAGSITPVEALKARLDPASARRARLRWLVAVFVAVGAAGLFAWPQAAVGSGFLRSVAVYALLLGVVLALAVRARRHRPRRRLPFRWLFRLEERLARAALARDRSRTTLTVGALTVGSRDDRRDRRRRRPLPRRGERVARGGDPGRRAPDLDPPDRARRGDRGRRRRDRRRRPGQPDRHVRRRAATASGPTPRPSSARTSSPTAGCGSSPATGPRPSQPSTRAASSIVPLGLADPRRPHRRVGARPRDRRRHGSCRCRSRASPSGRCPGPAARRSSSAGRTRRSRSASPAPTRSRSATSPAARPTPGRRSTSSPRESALEPTPLEPRRGAVDVALGRVFGLFDALAIIAVIVAALGIVNTLSMNVLERVRELGVLRAAGMTRTQVRRTVVVEAGILGLAARSSASSPGSSPGP